MPRTIWLFPVLGLKHRACLSLLIVLGWRSRILSSFLEQVLGGHYDPPPPPQVYQGWMPGAGQPGGGGIQTSVEKGRQGRNEEVKLLRFPGSKARGEGLGLLTLDKQSFLLVGKLRPVEGKWP